MVEQHDRVRSSQQHVRKVAMSALTVTTPNNLEIRVEAVFDAPRERVFSVWTDPLLIVKSHDDGTVVLSMDVRPGGSYSFRMPIGPVEGEYLEVVPPERLVQTFNNHVHPHLQILEFEELGDRTKLTQTMRFDTTEARDTTLRVAVKEGAEDGFARIDALLQQLALDA
jgi:uncharacterized protein YndB with AHSA1/START domain